MKLWKPFETEQENLPLRSQGGELSQSVTPMTSLSNNNSSIKNSSRRCTPAKLKCGVILTVIFLIIAGIIGISIALNNSYNDALDTGPCVSDCPRCRRGVKLPPAEPLPTPDLATKTDPWYISTNTKTQPIAYDSSEQNLRVDYKPGKWGSANGADFKSNPRKALPADSAVLSYSVYFPENFPWKRGGKLPGFCISDSPGTNNCATGSDWQWGAGSLRMMWREGGRAIGYTYIPLQAGFVPLRWSTWGTQGSDYKRVASDTGSTGDDVFCKIDGGLILKAGEWNEITMVVAMNTPGLANGWISLTLNGETRTTKGVRWRGLSNKVQITSVLFATFFGGGDKTWSTDQKTYALFKDFKFSAPADLNAADL